MYSGYVMAELPHLLHFRVSHFNEKVRWALDLKRVPHRRTSLIPGFQLAPVRRLTGQNKLPVLIMGDGQVYSDSTTILAELGGATPSRRCCPPTPRCAPARWRSRTTTTRKSPPRCAAFSGRPT